MPKLNGMVAAEIPYYNMIKKAMPKQTKPKKKVTGRRLTEIDPKTDRPRLKQGVSVERAIEVLFMFENTDVLPRDIEVMKETIENQRQRLLKLEDW